MARAKKNTVDYFPHNCIHGKTLKIFESKYDHGFKFWFKLLELLGQTPNHYYDCKKEIDRLWLVEYCLQSGWNTEVTEMLDCLATLEAIDPDLWQSSRIIWSQNFVDNLEGVYSKRSTDIPIKPNGNGNPSQIVIPVRKSSTTKQTGTEKHQSKLKDTKVKKTKVIAPTKFKIPTKKEMVDYADKRNIPRSIAGDCYYYYDKIGWTIGKDQKPMVSWKSALSGWWNREKNKL